ncbi:MAG: hypothetical protein EA401_10320 [Planctomycetota bacterium]|nr:MAG: hypothetical protein EA401_10320 [Planctomycetota bacterium]
MRKIFLVALVLTAALWVCCGSMAQLGADEDREVRRIMELMASLPAPPPVELREVEPSEGFQELAPAIEMKMGEAVRLHAQSIFDSGPDDGLEVMFCLQGGKNHEAIGWIPTTNAQMVKSAFILALDLEDGVGSYEDSGIPVRGTPVQMLIRWQPDRLLDPDRWVEVDASQMVRSRGTDHAYPPVPYMYTGSRIYRTMGTNREGKPVELERFMLEVTKSVAVNYDEPDALLGSPFPTAARDVLFEMNSAIAPPPRTPMLVYFRRVELPLTLRSDAENGLWYKDEKVDDEALQQLLQRYYGGETPPNQYAVALARPKDVPREEDLPLRERLLEAAVAAEVWVVPVFTLIRD